MARAVGPASPRTRLALALLLLGAALALGAGLWGAPVDSRAEQRCLDIVSDMRVTGDWLVPRRDGLPWLNKPPLLYWCATGLARVSGLAPLTALRLVSLLATLGVAALIVRWAAGRVGARTGLLAAALFVAMSEVVARGREGTVEMTLCLLTNACLFLFAEREFHPRAPRREGAGVLFATCLGAAILTKATMALLVVGVPITLSLVVRRRAAVLRARRTWELGLLALALGFSWHVLLSLVVPGAFATFTNAALLPLGVATEAQAVMHSATHYEPWSAPLGFLLRGAFPVTLLLPLVFWRGARTRFWRDDPELRFHALTVLGLLGAFMLLPQKRPHYLLPALPSLALLVAHAMRAAWREGGRAARALRWTFAGWLQLLTLFGTVGLLFWFGVVLRVSPLLLAATAVCALVVSLAGAHALVTRRDARLGALGLVVWWTLVAVHAGSVSAWRERVRSGAVDAVGAEPARAGSAPTRDARTRDVHTADARADVDPRRWSRLRAEFPLLLAAFEPRDTARDEAARQAPATAASPPRATPAGSDSITSPVESPPCRAPFPP